MQVNRICNSWVSEALRKKENNGREGFEVSVSYGSSEIKGYCDCQREMQTRPHRCQACEVRDLGPCIHPAQPLSCDAHSLLDTWQGNFMHLLYTRYCPRIIHASLL